MKKIVVGSIRESAGKTSVIVGFAKASGTKFGYMKPFGDRLLYRKKRLWDHDAALLTALFRLDEDPGEISIGFEHPKLRFMYDEAATSAKLNELVERVRVSASDEQRDIIFIEGGRDISYGSSVHLDSFAIARNLNAQLLLVAAGDENIILDDLRFLKESVDLKEIDFLGVIINRVLDPDDFKTSHMHEIEDMGIPILGILPEMPELGHFSVRFLAERLLAKVVAGEEGLDRPIRNIFVGAMSASVAQNNPLFHKEEKLIITSGDRADLILAAIEQNTSGIILTNNVFPPSNIISRAESKNVPLILVPFDTYRTVKMIDGMEPLLTPGETKKVELLGRTIEECVNIDKMLEHKG